MAGLIRAVGAVGDESWPRSAPIKTYLPPGSLVRGYLGPHWHALSLSPRPLLDIKNFRLFISPCTAYERSSLLGLCRAPSQWPCWRGGALSVAAAAAAAECALKWATKAFNVRLWMAIVAVNGALNGNAVFGTYCRAPFMCHWWQLQERSF